MINDCEKVTEIDDLNVNKKRIAQTQGARENSDS